mgnify:CR=1 FL=1
MPLAAVATLRYDLEQPTVLRRSRIPTITLKAGILTAAQPATVVRDLEPSVQSFRTKLPVGYSVNTAGTVEESGKAQGPIAAVVPLMLFVMATILMIQLQSFQRLFLVVAVAPLGLIGVVLARELLAEMASGRPPDLRALAGLTSQLQRELRTVQPVIQVSADADQRKHEILVCNFIRPDCSAGLSPLGFPLVQAPLAAA